MENLALKIIILVLLVPGILGVLLPVVPGIPYMFLVVLVASFLPEFSFFSTNILLILGSIAIVSLCIDYFSGIVGGKIAGANEQSLFWGIIGALLGTILLPPFGGIILMVVVIFLAEFFSHSDYNRALKATGGSVAGSFVGIGIKLLLALVFFFITVYFSFFV